METVERRNNVGSAKTTKKAGKRTKALTAEEEARRREELKEKLREKLELERRALKVVERLLEDNVSEDFLVDCARFITQANYKDAIEERSIAELCGYPICPNKLGKIPTQQYKISTKTNKVYDITERKCFCSNFCYKASKEFELQISGTALWLRQNESPSEIKLLKKGDGGSSGEEVMLSERRLQEDDIENTLALPPADYNSSQLSSTASGRGHNDNSDFEQEQDFVSSVVSLKQRPRVHWAELPKRTDEEKKGVQERTETHEHQNIKKTETHVCEMKVRTDGKKTEELNIINADQVLPDDSLEDQSIEETTTKLNVCTLSQAVTSLPDGSITTKVIHTSSLTKSCKDLNPPTEGKHQLDCYDSNLKCSDNNNKVQLQNQSGLNITQIGMSKRGAAGLRDLLKNQSSALRPDSVRLKLLECLKRTLKEWSTDETLKFLYGADHTIGSPFADVKEETKELEEELDEDDFEDSAVSDGRASAAAPDYEALRKESQHMELRIREFYKGTWILPEELEKHKQSGSRVTAQNQCAKEPILPLVDSHAQHIIQKRITVEKLTNCLRNIVGPLRLTMNDITNDLNNMVRTFRFTNTNIIHKTPEWTLIAVVLLHLLAEVSPVVQEALQKPASVEYLNTLMDELSLQEQDLLDIVQLFKTTTQ